MAQIKVAPGSKIRVKSSGVLGTVIDLTPQKVPGKRGRPQTNRSWSKRWNEERYGVRELTLAATERWSDLSATRDPTIAFRGYYAACCDSLR